MRERLNNQIKKWIQLSGKTKEELKDMSKIWFIEVGCFTGLRCEECPFASSPHLWGTTCEAVWEWGDNHTPEAATLVAEYFLHCREYLEGELK